MTKRSSKIIDVGTMSEEMFAYVTLVEQAILLGTADDFELRECARGSFLCRADMRVMAQAELDRRARLDA